MTSGTTAADPAPPGRRQARDLDAAEIEAFLYEMKIAVLATSRDGVPYAVPVAYGYDGTDFFIAMNQGRKAANLDLNPLVCLTIMDVQEIGARWRSAVVAGTGSWISGMADRLHAFDTLRRHHKGSYSAGPRDLARLARARLLRISPTLLTGRAVGV
jgi:nitroimidazol reductase NimA-like FMN-containing flavoprotein (pyridoxamine 5'-phosphate oxidase superfamily)